LSFPEHQASLRDLKETGERRRRGIGMTYRASRAYPATMFFLSGACLLVAYLASCGILATDMLFCTSLFWFVGALLFFVMGLVGLSYTKLDEKGITLGIGPRKVLIEWDKVQSWSLTRIKDLADDREGKEGVRFQIADHRIRTLEIRESEVLIPGLMSFISELRTFAGLREQQDFDIRIK
jgi:hypothetical protein